MKHYIIVADYIVCGKPSTCLVKLAGNSLEQANGALNNLQANLLRDGKNPRIEEVERKDCWWLDGGLD